MAPFALGLVVSDDAACYKSSLNDAPDEKQIYFSSSKSDGSVL